MKKKIKNNFFYKVVRKYLGLEESDIDIEELKTKVFWLEKQAIDRNDRLEARLDQLLQDLQNPKALTQIRYYRVGNPYIKKQ